METKTIIKILDHLKSEYSKNWTKNERHLKIQTWSTILSDLTDEQGIVGLRKALEDPGEFMPPVGKFKQMCLSGAGCKNFEDEAIQAWALVMSNLNSSIAPVFLDACIAEAVNKMGGWRPFCLSIDKFTEKRKKDDFVNFYMVARNSKEKFCPMPEQTTKIFHDGEYQHDRRFIGAFDRNAKLSALAQIEQREQAKSKFLTLTK